MLSAGSACQCAGSYVPARCSARQRRLLTFQYRHPALCSCLLKYPHHRECLGTVNQFHCSILKITQCILQVIVSGDVVGIDGVENIVKCNGEGRIQREVLSTSAVISRLSGSSKSLSPDTRSSRESEFNPRLSCRPGIPNPITMFLLPSEMTLPLSILTLEKVSCGRIIPVIRTNGVYIVSFLPLMSTVVFVLFVLVNFDFQFSLFPARSSGLISLPSR